MAQAPLSVHYGWSWKSDNGMVHYSPVQSMEIELAYQLCPCGDYKFSVGKDTYKIHLSTFEQENIKSSKKRRIERFKIRSQIVPEHVRIDFFTKLAAFMETKLRQNYCIKFRGRESDVQRAIAAMQTELLANKVRDEKLEVSSYITPVDQANFYSLAFAINVHFKLNFNSLVMNGMKEKVNLYCREIIHLVSKLSQVLFPQNWEPQSANLHKTLPSNEEKQEITRRFAETMPDFVIYQIERVQNKWLWEKYYVQKQRMEKKLLRRHNIEKLLFHGTSKTRPEQIYNGQDGFDPKFASDGLWGRGTYFATSASYSDWYAFEVPGTNLKQVFYAAVLVGDSISLPQDKSRKMPPPKPGPSDISNTLLFDSVIADTKTSINYVVFDPERAYPSFLVTYKKKH